MHTNRMALASGKFKSVASESAKAFLLHHNMWKAFHGESRYTHVFSPHLRWSLMGRIATLMTLLISNHLPRAPDFVCHEHIHLELCWGLSLQHANFWETHLNHNRLQQSHLDMSFLCSSALCTSVWPLYFLALCSGRVLWAHITFMAGRNFFPVNFPGESLLDLGWPINSP